MNTNYIKKFFNRVMYRNYWFYRNVIKESNSFMQYYYASFAYSMYIVFYIIGLILFIGRKTEIEVLQWNRIRLTIVAFLIIIINLTYFFSNRINIEHEIKKKSKMPLYDVIAVIYIVFSFIVFFISIYRLKA